MKSDSMQHFSSKSSMQTHTNTLQANQGNLNIFKTSQSLPVTCPNSHSQALAKILMTNEVNGSISSAIKTRQAAMTKHPMASATIVTVSALKTNSDNGTLRKSRSMPILRRYSQSDNNIDGISCDNCDAKFNSISDDEIERTAFCFAGLRLQTTDNSRESKHRLRFTAAAVHRRQLQQQQQDCATTAEQLDKLRFGCKHYKRRAMFVTPCCNKFYKCRFCHDENESHHFDRKTLTELICSECHTRQKVQEQCEHCNVRFGKYTCLICNLFDDVDKKQFHCKGCGICRIGGAENFFHCEVCNMCLPMQLKIDGHRCVENVSRSHCPVCLGDIHTSRIPCHIPDCGHLLHKMCFDQLLASGHYACPTCQTSLIDMSALWEYLDAQALLMPMSAAYENQRMYIFCNDCHKTSKTKYHFIGLKCMQCGAYNTTQDIKRRMSFVADEPTSA